jgi:hypothetical protein
MKHMMASLTIGTCLLLPSAGVVFAMDPHSGPVGPHPGAHTTGQAGTGGSGVAACGGGGSAGSPPGQVGGSSNSPFIVTKEYAGAGAGNSGANSPHANSQYDLACFQHP